MDQYVCGIAALVCLLPQVYVFMHVLKHTEFGSSSVLEFLNDIYLQIS